MKSVIKVGVVFLLVIMMLSIPDFFKNYYVLKKTVFWSATISLSLVGLLLFSFLLLFYKNIRLMGYILTFFSFLTPMISIYYVVTRSLLSKQVFHVVSGFNLTEVLDIGIGYLILSVVVSVFYAGLFLIIVTKLPKKISFAPAFLLTIIGVSLFFFLSHQKRTPIFGFVNRNSFFSSFYAWNQYLSDVKLMGDYKEKIKDFSFEAKQKKKNNNRKIMVIVLGESANYDHWQVNGYSRKTSPLLSSQANFLSFGKVVSSANYTSKSVALVLTRATVDEYKIMYTEPGFSSAFKEVGYKTIFISFNDQFELHSAASTIHAGDFDETIWLRERKRERLDIAFVSELEEKINRTNENLLVVLHTLGSHMDYKGRFPERFNVFKPSNFNKPWPSEKEKLINAYDNSILYTDYVVNSLIETLKQKTAESIVFYVSDHGEELYQNKEENYFGHGFSTKKIHHVPLFIWYSEEFKKRNKLKVKALEKNKDLKISSSENTFYTVLDLADISHKYEDNTKSFSSSEFIENKQLIEGSDGKKVLFSELEY